MFIPYCTVKGLNRKVLKQDQMDLLVYLYILYIFSSLWYFGATLRQKYQFVRPENDTKAACAIVTISRKRIEINTCRVWNTLGCFKPVPNKINTRLRTRPPFDRVKNNNLADFLLSSLRGFLYEFLHRSQRRRNLYTIT